MQHSATRNWRVLVVAVVALASMVAAGCAPPAPTAPPVNSAGLRATLVTGGIELEWRATPSGQVHGYELQYLVDAGWTTIPTGLDPEVTFTDVTPRTRYMFRVRSRVAPGAPSNEFSSAVVSWYVEPQLPIVRIDTENAAPILDRENYVRATMSLDPNGSGFAPYSGTLGIRGRGNTTWTADKKPYRLRLDTRSPLMGIASERDWVLLANHFDKSQLRTNIAMAASRATDLPYTPTLRHVEVILNGRYDGVYVLTQHNEIGPDRVNITGMNPTDISGTQLTGGYRLEIDERLEENDEPGFRTARNLPIVVKDPDPATPEQFAYIRSYVQAFEDSLFASNFKDPVNGYRRYLDTGSFADHYLVQELTRNQDHFFSSTFFTKERGDDRFRFGPVWDFDISIGSTRGVRPIPPEGWWARTRGAWNYRIFNDEAFVGEVAARWSELRPEFERIVADIEPLGTSLRSPIDNDAARWNYTLETTDTPEFLTDWMNARIAWMDAQLSSTG
jgi:hypothetical protein